MNPRRLYRSRDRQLAGVAGGLAEYLEIDPTVIRILWILAAVVTGGLAILAYIVLALVVPPIPVPTASYAAAPGSPTGWATAPGGTAAWQPAGAAPAWGPEWGSTSPAAQPRPQSETRGIGAAAIVGVVLIVFGTIALLDAVLPAWSAAVVMGPAVILALGAALLVASIRRQAVDDRPAVPSSPGAGTATEAWDAVDTQAFADDAVDRQPA